MNKNLSPSKSSHSLLVSQINSLQPQQNYPQHHFTFETHSQHSHSNILHTQQKDQQTQHSQQYRIQLQKQHKMRIQSIIKGYQVKISREQQTFQLKQLKYIQQIQYLKRQLKQLCSINKDTKSKINDNNHCSICSNGDIVNFMKNMLQAVQNDHRGCLTQKTILNAKILALQQKSVVLQNQNQQAENRYNKAKQQIKQYKIDKQNWEREKRQKQRQIRDLQRQVQIKQMSLQQQISKLKVANRDLQADYKKQQIRHIQALSHIKQQKEKPKNKDNLRDTLNKFMRQPIAMHIPPPFPMRQHYPLPHRQSYQQIDRMMNHKLQSQQPSLSSYQQSYQPYPHSYQHPQQYDNNEQYQKQYYKRTINQQQYQRQSLNQSAFKTLEKYHHHYQQPIININREQQIYLPKSKPKYQPQPQPHPQPHPQSMYGNSHYTQKLKVFLNQQKVSNNRQPLKNMISSNINIKGQSYAQYANNKRKGNKVQSKSGIFNSQNANVNDTFQTFRPNQGRNTANGYNRGQSRDAGHMKYSYLEH